MNRFHRVLIYPFLLLITFLSFCNKTLDIAPVSSISSASFFKTESDVRGANFGMYIKLRNETSFNSFALGELRSETVTSGLAGMGGYDRYYLNTIDVNVTTPLITWTGYYSVVNAAKRMNGGVADFTTALEACNAVQTADVSMLPVFSTIFDYTNKGNKEILMAVNYLAVEAVDNYFFNGWLSPTTAYLPTTEAAGRTAVGQLGGNNIWSPSALVRNQFTMDDQRRNATFIEVYNVNATTGARTLFGAVINKGDGTVIGGTRFYADDIILYRYADVLLLKAEAKNGLGQDPSPEINLVRQRAYGTAFSAHTFINGSKDANDVAILQERLFELAYEGKRWWDLVRFGKAFDLVPSLQNRRQEHLLLHPVNALTLSLEPKVMQNPGYQ